jgi:PEP-CTERM motif
MKKLVAVGALLAAGAAQAHLSFSGGAFTTFSNYNPAGTGDGSNVATGAQSSGWLDATISASAGGMLTATFLGEAAGHDNAFFLRGIQRSSNGTSAVGNEVHVAVPAGTLDWFFRDLNDSTVAGNGGSGSVHGSYVILGTMDPRSGGGFVPYTQGGRYTYVLGFNDGAKVDADYDDHVLGLSIQTVPEPDTHTMLLAGLAAMGLIARRRRTG